MRCRNLERLRGFYRTASLSRLNGANGCHSLIRSHLASTSFVESWIGQVLKALPAPVAAKRQWSSFWSDHGRHSGHMKEGVRHYSPQTTSVAGEEDTS